MTDTEGVAKMTCVCTRTVQNWMAEKKIPYIRISPRCVRFNKRAVTEALGKFTVKAAA